ncbi:MAG: B12-binding domain-containing radical SAM protein [Candidatus Scalinduaceae bacterium]
MKIKLIYPRIHPTKRLRWKGLVPPLNLCYLAALTPKDISVKIVDTDIEPLNFDEPVALVGITATTATVTHAYAIADEFRRRGRKVVIGGIHASVLPNEALRHADAVVVGEAEPVWNTVLEDAANGRLKGIYKAKELPDSSAIPFPRRDMLKPKGYIFNNTMETSRGCPMSCHFCTVPLIYGKRYRVRPIPSVVEEIKKMGARRIFFVDDNIAGVPARAKELFKALIPLKVKWVGQATIRIANDEELLRLASKSGCMVLFIGLESVDPGNMKSANKSWANPENYLRCIKIIQKYSIGIEGAFIFGLDEDTPSVFSETVNFAEKAKLETARFSILKPFPGTELRERLLKEGRILTSNWRNYDNQGVVFQPKRISPEELSANREWAYDRFYRLASIFRRIGLWRKNITLLWIANLANKQFRSTRTSRKAHLISKNMVN